MTKQNTSTRVVEGQIISGTELTVLDRVRVRASQAKDQALNAYEWLIAQLSSPRFWVWALAALLALAVSALAAGLIVAIGGGSFIVSMTATLAMTAVSMYYGRDAVEQTTQEVIAFAQEKRAALAAA